MLEIVTFALLFSSCFAEPHAFPPADPKSSIWDTDGRDLYFWSCVDTDYDDSDEYGASCSYYQWYPEDCGSYDVYDYWNQEWSFVSTWYCCGCGGGQWNVQCQTDADCPNGYICPTTPYAHHEEMLGFYPRYCNKGIRTDLFETYGDCEVSGGTGECYSDANCVSSQFFGIDYYRANEFCQVIMTEAVNVTTSDTWSMECGWYDGMYVDNSWTCESQYVPPYLYPGQKVEWWTDELENYEGWQLCFTKMEDIPVQESDLVKVVGDCELRDTCVSSANYPETYGDFSYCTVEALTNLILTPTPDFNIEPDYSDHLIVGWGDPIYDSNDVPTALTKGYKIVWDTDTSTGGSGWEICFEEKFVPEEWRCQAQYYDNGDGCDCGCGATDPDCLTSFVNLWGCEGPKETHSCNATTNLCHDSEGNMEPAYGWTCNADYYATGDGCDCGCGAVDPDCLGDFDKLYNCNDGEYCSSLHGNCVAAESTDDEGDITTDTPVTGEPETCEGSGTWQVGEFGECSNECGSGYQVREIVCSTGVPTDCTDVKPTEYQECNTDECLGPCAGTSDDLPGLVEFATGLGYPAPSSCDQVTDFCEKNEAIANFCAETCCLQSNKIDLGF